MRFSYMSLATVACLAVLHSSVALSSYSSFVVHLSQGFDLREMGNRSWEISPTAGRPPLMGGASYPTMILEPDSNNPNQLILTSPGFRSGRVITLTLTVQEQNAVQSLQQLNHLEFNLESLSTWLRGYDSYIPRQTMLNIFTSEVMEDLLGFALVAGNSDTTTPEPVIHSVIDFLTLEGADGDTTHVSPPTGRMTVRRDAMHGNHTGIQVYHLIDHPDAELPPSISTATIALTTYNALWLQKHSTTKAACDWVASKLGYLKDSLPTTNSVRGWGHYFFGGSKKEAVDANDPCLITKGDTCNENEYAKTQWQALSLALTLYCVAGFVEPDYARSQLLDNKAYSW